MIRNDLLIRPRLRTNYISKKVPILKCSLIGQKSKTKWYIIVAPLVCGLLVLLAITLILIKLRQRRTKNQNTCTSRSPFPGDKGNPSHQEHDLNRESKGVSCRPFVTTTGNSSGYQELNLNRMTCEGEGYQALLRINGNPSEYEEPNLNTNPSGGKSSQPLKTTGNSSGYQELDVTRMNDQQDYEPLRKNNDSPSEYEEPNLNTNPSGGKSSPVVFKGCELFPPDGFVFKLASSYPEGLSLFFLRGS